jgi:diacylglycerol kinase family enzyme
MRMPENVQTDGQGGPEFESGIGMNVWILCNEAAGRGSSADELQKMTEKAGHSVLGVAQHYDERTSLPRGLDVVVAAGGDGTVATGAGIASKISAPLAILPLGTANNVAASLGLSAPVPELIASWSTARRMPFDLGSARAASKQWLVVEGVGAGLVPVGIARAQAELENSVELPPAAEVAASIRAFRAALVDLEPSPWTLVLDGEKISGAFLAVEILNIRSVGPNLVLGPDAIPSDGYFDVIMAEHRHRQELLTYLQCRADRREARLTLPCRRAREVVIDGCAALHIDDERVDSCALGPVTIGIEPAAITVLV